MFIGSNCHGSLVLDVSADEPSAIGGKCSGMDSPDKGHIFEWSYKSGSDPAVEVELGRDPNLCHDCWRMDPRLSDSNVNSPTHEANPVCPV